MYFELYIVFLSTNPQEKKKMLNKYSEGAYILVLLVLLMMTDFPV